MNSLKVKQLIEKLDCELKRYSMIVSPILLAPKGKKSSLLEFLKLSKDMSLNGLSKDKLLYVHTLLHLFYNNGSKDLGKLDIRVLHSKVSVLFNHKYFDKLDD